MKNIENEIVSHTWAGLILRMTNSNNILSIDKHSYDPFIILAMKKAV
jgi:hypothetical protein